MKKIICLLIAVMLTVCIFAGCGDDKAESGMMSDVSEAMTDAMSEAETIMDGMTNGEVSDGDGIIGNEGSENNNDNSSSTDSNSSNSDNSSDLTDASAMNDDLM